MEDKKRMLNVPYPIRTSRDHNSRPKWSEAVDCICVERWSDYWPSVEYHTFAFPAPAMYFKKLLNVQPTLNQPTPEQQSCRYRPEFINFL